MVFRPGAFSRAKSAIFTGTRASSRVAACPDAPSSSSRERTEAEREPVETFSARLHFIGRRRFLVVERCRCRTVLGGAKRLFALPETC